MTKPKRRSLQQQIEDVLRDELGVLRRHAAGPLAVTAMVAVRPALALVENERDLLIRALLAEGHAASERPDCKLCMVLFTIYKNRGQS